MNKEPSPISDIELYQLPDNTMLRCACGHVAQWSEFKDSAWCEDCGDTHDACPGCDQIYPPLYRVEKS